MKTFYQLFIALFAVLTMSLSISTEVYAQAAVQSISSGDWSNPDNWDCGCVPAPMDDVTIAASTEINVTENSTVNNITVAENGLLSLSPSLVIELTVTGDWNNEGTFQAETGKVIFSGNDPQTVTGVNSFYDLEIVEDHDVELTEETNITHTLSIDGANLVTNGFLNLKSTIGSTATVLPLLNGTITGDVRMEKVFHNTTAGWMQFTVPFTDVTFEQLNDDLPTTGYEGSNFPNYNFVSVRYYNEPTAETGSGAYSGVESAYDTIVPGLGYSLYSNAGTYTLDFQGTIVTGETSLPVTYTDHGETKLDGLNLVGNPYPGTIDWTSETGWDRSNVSGALYLWNTQMKRFKTYLNGYSVNGGSPIINTGDSFWIQTNGESPEVNINETAKTQEITAEVNAADNFLKMKLGNGTSQDEMMIVLDENASLDYETNRDAFKFENSSNPINISSLSADDLTLCINSVPLGNEGFQIPLIVRLSEAGDYTLEIQDLPEVFIEERCFGIEDLVTGEYYDLDETEVIEFSSDAVTDQQRFMVHLSERVAPEVTNIACFGDANGQISVGLTQDGPFDYYLYDNNMNEIASVMQTVDETVFEDLTPGTYTVEVHAEGFCPVRSIQTQITQGSEITAHAVPQHIDCGEDLVGAIDLLPVGGTGPLSFEWSNGEVTEDLDGISGGNYTVTITDSLGCSREMTYVVNEAVDVEASFETTEDDFQLEGGVAEVQFVNNTQGATEFLWDFDDNSEGSTEENPIHEFTEQGFYIVSLVAQNNDCQDNYQMVINVQPATSVDELSNSSMLSIHKDQTGWYLAVDFARAHYLEVNVYNLVGQKVVSTITGNYDKDRINLGSLDQAQLKLIEVRDLESGEARTFKVTN